MEVADFKELLIFEPRGFVAYFKAIWHNSFEIIFVLATVGLQLLMPSGYSVCMWLASHSLLISASYRPVARIRWGAIFAGINLFLCAYILAQKLSVMSGGSSDGLIASVPSFTCGKSTTSASGAGHGSAESSIGEYEGYQLCHFNYSVPMDPQPKSSNTNHVHNATAEFIRRRQQLSVWGYQI
jgi:hypothetical protein